MPETDAKPAASESAFGLRAMGREARKNQLSGAALMGMGLAVTVLAAAILMWAGIVTGPVRVILLVAAAIMMPVRVLINRLGAVVTADGIAGSTNSKMRRWLSHWEAALLMVAAGLCAFGSHKDLGLLMGPLTAVILLLNGIWGRAPGWRLYPTLLLAATALIAAFEPLWGWRGEALLIGLAVISVVLVVQALRRALHRPPAAPHPAAG